MTRYRPNPRLAQDVLASRAGQRVLTDAAERVAREATSRGRRVSSTYQTEVDSHGGTVRILATTRALIAGAWIEFGTPRLPAAAPLRNAVRACGYRLRGR